MPFKVLKDLNNQNIFIGGRNPRLSTYNYQSLPQPRDIGNSLFYNPVPAVQSKSNYFAILFGQFIAHDFGERVYYQVRKYWEFVHNMSYNLL